VKKTKLLEAYLQLWNDNSTNRWVKPFFPPEELDFLLSEAAEIVVRIRHHIDRKNIEYDKEVEDGKKEKRKLPRIRVLTGSVREYFWTVDVHPNLDPVKFVKGVVHATLKDLKGYVDYVTESEVDSYIELFHRHKIEKEEEDLRQGQDPHKEQQDSHNEQQDLQEDRKKENIHEKHDQEKSSPHVFVDTRNEGNEVHENSIPSEQKAIDRAGHVQERDIHEQIQEGPETKEEVKQTKEEKETEIQDGIQVTVEDTKEKIAVQEQDQRGEQNEQPEQEMRQEQPEQQQTQPEQEKIEREQAEGQTEEGRPEQNTEPNEQSSVSKSGKTGRSSLKDSGIIKIEKVKEDVENLRPRIQHLTEKLDTLSLSSDPVQGKKEVEQLQKKCVECTEFLMRDLLSLDAIVASQSAKPLRKEQVQIIQSMLNSVDAVKAKLSQFQRSLIAEEKKKAGGIGIPEEAARRARSART